MRLFPALSALGLFLSLCLSSISAGESKNQLSFAEWMQTYSASNPFTAIKKTTPFNITKAAIDDLTDGDDKLDPNHLNYLLGQEINRATRDNIMAEIVKSANDHTNVNYGLNERDLIIRKNLENFITAKKSGNVLAIAFVGTAHAVDFFLMHPDILVSYIAKPLQRSSELHSREFRLLMEFATKKKQMERAADDIHSMAWAQYHWVVTTLVQEKKKMPAFSENLSPNLKTWIIADLHNINETNWLENLPSPTNLKTTGINKIELAMEGAPLGPTDFQTLLKRRSMLEQIEFRAKKTGMTFDQFISPFPLEIQKNIVNGLIQDNPAITVLLRRLMEYQSSGIAVELTGIEAADYNPVESKP